MIPVAISDVFPTFIMWHVYVLRVCVLFLQTYIIIMIIAGDFPGAAHDWRDACEHEVC
jgi:hypothetical protein